MRTIVNLKGLLLLFMHSSLLTCSKLDSKILVSAQWSEVYTSLVLFCSTWAHTLVFHVYTDWKGGIQLEVEEQAHWSAHISNHMHNISQCDTPFSESCSVSKNWDDHLDKWLTG
jgi:hypothetical protein